VTAVRLHPDAEAELRAAAEWYEVRSPGLGFDLVAHVSAAIDAVVEQPSVGTPVRKAERGGLRRALVDRFPYGIIYLVRENEIVIVAVAHLSRRPGYWRSRLKPR
jgi:toxin ParE1/3/4